jgi:LCP family protein required for cell wall assembly
MGPMRPGFDARAKPRRPGALLVVVLAAFGALVGLGGYTAYRVAAFTGSVFVGSSPPPALREALPAPEPDEVEAEAEAGAVATPAAAPEAGAGTVVPARAASPPATPAATATPAVDETTIIGKLRAGRRVTFLLIGYGGLGHDGPYLTDALVVVSFEPKTGQLALFNLPRDLWVQTPTAGGRAGPYRKVNELYSLGLGQAGITGAPAAPADHDRAAWLVAAAAQQVLGLPIDGWASADFDAVRRVVDGLGGVVVDVETSFDDYLYPRHDDSSVDAGVMHVHFDAGPQRLTGARALQYVRSRHAEQDGGDFGRSRRQQRLLLALKDQMLTPATLPKVFQLMEAVQGHVRTSLSLAEARDLLRYGQDRNGGVQATPALIDTRELLVGAMSEGGASILVPKAGAGNYGAIHRFVRAALRGNQALARAR